MRRSIFASNGPSFRLSYEAAVMHFNEISILANIDYAYDKR